ncbi:xanthine dehydrogenase family protein molybdopterin-binding subunit [Pollutibacter soli]|uniref:xanthine dehydrogenase family protein molybdopterin-binding subunit n=1 Tax=Pollutibacter soli TaxID=3034157 RepID=UPI003013F6D9
MSVINTKYGRRSFIKSSFLAGGGLMLGFNSLASLITEGRALETIPDEWFNINAYLKISSDGVFTIKAPHPEFGTDVRTSLPMMVAEELDVDWKKVVVEQADYKPSIYGRQYTGGSRGVMEKWVPLRTTGAAARQMLIKAAAKTWDVPEAEITTEGGVLYHKASGKSAKYEEMAARAAEIPVPEKVALKDPKDFKIIGTSRANVDLIKMVTGKAPYSSDINREGMLYAMVVIPPAFGMKLKSFDALSVKSMPGIKDVFSFKTYEDGYKRNMFDTNAFPELVAIVGNSTWEVLNAKNKLKVEWQPFTEQSFVMAGFRGEQTVVVPPGLESSSDHKAKMKDAADKPGRQMRKDGNPEEVFKNAAKVIERTYSAPFLPHYMMEPITSFAHYTDEGLFVAGPVQSPETTINTISSRIGLPPEKIHIELTRMGGGFGRHFHAHCLTEAAVISQKVKAPIKLQYTREDTTNMGSYRPACLAVYRAALDKDNNLIAFHVKAGGVPDNGLNANAFPAGAVDNYLAESFSIASNITSGWFRAPGDNFIGGVEQSFLDEIAEAAGKDPIEFRLELLKRSKEKPVGARADYDASRYAGVLELVREKSNWAANKKRGVAAYLCHRAYAAHVIDVVVKDNVSRVQSVFSAVDCGIVVNPDSATNMVEGNVVDAIGHAMYGELTFTKGKPDSSNLGKYRLIRMNEAPKNIEVHFVKNDIAPTGLGEGPYPSVFGALANALYKATGKRFYHQPFIKNSF